MTYHPHEDTPPSTTGIIGGFHAVLSQLTHAPERVQKVWLAEGRHDKRLQQVFELARQHGKLVQNVPTSQLDKRVEPGFRHQGVLAAVLPKPPLELHDLLDRIKTDIATQKPVCVLVLDHVSDPHNLGAVLRVADAAGVTALLLPKRGGLVASPVVAKVSAGAIETVDCVWVANLAQALTQLKQAGCWVVGTVCDDHAVPFNQHDWRVPTVLLMGAEEKGLGPKLQQACDFGVTIPMAGQVQSLNVACATSVVLFAWRMAQTIPTTAKP
jgi:23S rRNA (guanosine2251-2'-O)-methyltransferase